MCRKTLTRQYWHSAFIIWTTRFIALELVAQLWRSISSGRLSTADTLTVTGGWRSPGHSKLHVAHNSRATLRRQRPAAVFSELRQVFSSCFFTTSRCKIFSVIQANHCVTRSPAIAEGPRDAPCQLKLRKMLHKCSSNCI